MILVLLGIFILGFGARAVVIGTAANEVGESLDKAVADDPEPGAPDSPMTITEGKAFEVRGFKYNAGWKVKSDPLTDCTTNPIQPGNTVMVDCLGGDPMPKKLGRIAINDTF